MKQSKTTLKELTAAYRAVLRHAVLCNAIALGLIAVVPARAETVTPPYVIDTTSGDVTFTGHTGSAGALSSTVGGSITTTGNNAVIFSGNTSTDHGAGFYYKNGTAADPVVFNTDVSFINNEVLSSASSGSGAGMFISGGSVSLLGQNNTFTNNQMNATIDESRWYKVGGGAIANQSYETDNGGSTPLDATMIIGTSESVNTFSNNTSTTNGGAIMNRALKGGNDNDGNAYLTINGTTIFDNNTTVFGGGAIYNKATGGNIAQLNLNNGTYTFINNTASGTDTEWGDGGAIYNSGNATIANATFGGIDNSGETPLSLGNTADRGGAIYNSGTMSLTGDFISNNALYYGGAIFNVGEMDIIGTAEDKVIFSENSSAYDGGAIFNSDELNINWAEFNSNHSTDDEDAWGGAIANGGILSIDNTIFDGNTAKIAGAIIDYLDSTGGVSVGGSIQNTIFRNNTAEEIGAVGLYTKYATSRFENVEFTSNSATLAGPDSDGSGAIFAGAQSQVIIADSLFDSNESAARAGAIGTRAFKQGDNHDATLDITGTTFTNNTAATNGGAIDNFFYNDENNDGHVLVSDSTFTSNSAANGGAVYNHIGHIGDKLINADITGQQTAESDASLIQVGNIMFVDSNFINNTASDLGGALYNEGIMTVAAENADVTFSGNTANGEANDIYNIGTLTLNAAEGHSISLAGGITGASDSIATNIVNIAGLGNVSVTNALTYQTVNNSGNLSLNADLTGTTITNAEGATITLARDIAFEGGENTLDGYNGELTNDITVANGAELTINNATFASGDGDLVNEQGGILRINDSLVNVDVTNHGTLISDPTYYTAQVVNSGTASFNGDIFESTSSLINNGGEVSLTDVEFVQGSTVSGDGNGHLNIQNGQTIFDTVVQNNTLTMTNGANVVVGQHGSLDGVGITAAGGTINLNNGHIDELGDLVANSNVGMSLDANFNSGEADTVSHVTGSGKLLINNINLLSSSYGDTEGAFSWTVAENDTNSVELANGFTVTGGTNYFTSVTTDGQNIMFSDKLMNSSGVYAQLGSWNGTIIGTSTEYDSETNSYSSTAGTTVGAALTALENAVNGKQDTITNTATIAADGTGFSVVAGSIGATQLAANSVASSNIIDGTIVNDDIATGTITTDRLASQNVSQFTNDAGYQNATQVSDAISSALANGTNAYQTAANVTETLGAYSTTEQMNTAISDALANNGDAYQTSSQVAASISNALANNGDAYQTESQVNTTVNNAITSALGTNGAVGGAITTATTMADDGNADTTLYSNFSEGASVTSAVASLDSAIGTTAAGTHVAATNSVGQNINALDSAIGSTNTGNHVTATNSVGQNLNSLDTALASAESDIDTLNDQMEVINGDENTTGSMRNIAKSYFDLVTAQDSALTLSQANAYTDERIEKLDKNMSSGIASAVALSSVAVSDVRRGEVSVGAGYGYFNGQSAGAFGAAMGISNRWSVNAGAGISGYDVSFRAGTNYKFKLF